MTILNKHLLKNMHAWVVLEFKSQKMFQTGTFTIFWSSESAKYLRLQTVYTV